MALGEGVPTVPLFGSIFWRENPKLVPKFKKQVQKIKKQTKYVFFAKGPYYAVLFLSDRDEGVGTR